MIKKLGKDMVVYGSADFLFKLIAFSVFPIYTQYFSVAEFGVFSLLTVTSTLIGVLINLGVNNAVQRFYWDVDTTISEQPSIVSTGLLQLILSGTVFLILIILIGYTNKELIFKRYGIEWGLIVLSMATILPDQILQYCLDAIRLEFKPFQFMMISFTKNVLGVFLGIYFILHLNKGLAGLFAGPLIGSVVALPLALTLIRKNLTFRFSKAITKDLIHFGFPFVFTGMAYWAFGSLDRWMLAEMSSVREVGLYSVAFKFAAVISFVTLAFGQAWSPYAIKLTREDPHYRKTYGKIFSLWFFTLAVLGFAISVFSKELLHLLTPQEYWPGASVLSIVIAGSVLYGTTQITAIGISLQKKTRILTLGASLAALVNFIFNYLLIPRYGAIGAAIGTLVANFFLTATFLFFTQKLHRVELEKSKLLYSCFILFLSVIIPFISNYFGNSFFVIATKISFFFLLLLGSFIFRIIDWRFFTLLNRVKNKDAKSSYYGR